MTSIRVCRNSGDGNLSGVVGVVSRAFESVFCQWFWQYIIKGECEHCAFPFFVGVLERGGVSTPYVLVGIQIILYDQGLEKLILNIWVLLCGGGVEPFGGTPEGSIYSTITSSANSQPPKLLGSAWRRT